MSSRSNRWVSGLIAVVLLQCVLLTGVAESPARATGTANIYWTGPWGSQTIWSGSDSQAATPVDSGSTAFLGLTSDGQYLYFSRPSISGYEIVRADLDFQNQVVLAGGNCSTSVNPAYAMAVSNGNLYWASRYSWGGIFSISTTPSSSCVINQVVAPSTNGAPAFSANIYGLAVLGGNLYFDLNGSRLYRVGTSGGVVTAGSSVASITARGVSMTGVASDGTDLLVGTDGGGIYRVAPADWNNPSWGTMYATTAAINLDGVSQIAVYSGSLYFTSFGTKIGKMSLSGTNAQAWITNTGNESYGIAVAAPPAKVVTFDANGGSGSLASQSGSAAAALSSNAGAITRAGYTFNGWNTAANGTGTAYANGASYPFTSSVTLYAQWIAIPKSYIIDYAPQGGTGAAVSSYSQGDSVRIAYTPTRDGYQFDGWFLESTGGTALGAQFSPSGAKDFTIYAHWTKLPAPPSVTEVTVNLQGSKLGPLAGVVDAAIALPIPTKAGFTFDGWFREVIGGVPVSNPFIAPQAGDYTLFAHWTPVKVVKTTKPKPKHK